MDRIINVKVGGNHLSKDNKNAGVKGEANVTRLRITFDEGWDIFSKKVTFWDAKGNNPVVIDLVPHMADQSGLTYLVLIPAEPMAEAGALTFVIEGTKDDKVQRSLSDKLVVKDAPIAENAGQPIPPTEDELTQLQGEIESIKSDILGAALSKTMAVKAMQDAGKAKDAAEWAKKAAQDAQDKAEDSESRAEEYAEQARDALGKTNYIGENGNWYAWDSAASAFYDTGVKAQAGSTVYVGDNPPPEADVWIDPNGEVDTFIDTLWTDWRYLFAYNTRSDLLKKLKYSDTSNGTDFSFMFFGSNELTEIPLFDTSKAETLSNMCVDCTSLTEGLEINTPNVWNFNRMYEHCSGLKVVPAMDMSSIHCAEFMFNKCKALEFVGALNTYPGINIYFNHMFSECSSLKVIAGIDITNARDFYMMFNGCSELKILILNGKIKLPGLDLSYCPKLAKESIISVMNACVTDVWLHVTFSLNAVNSAFETTVGANDGSMSNEWKKLKATRSNVTVALK